MNEMENIFRDTGLMCMRIWDVQNIKVLEMRVTVILNH
jgi:hypothetical protein